MRRPVLALILAIAANPLAARAQQNWTPAPVPNVGSGLTVMPPARAGDAVQLRDAPFSAVPTGSIAADGATSENLVNRAGTPSVSPQ